MKKISKSNQNKTPTQQEILYREGEWVNPAYFIASIIAAIVPFARWIWFINEWGFKSRITDNNYGGIMFLIPIHVILLVLSIIWGIMNLKTKFRWLSLISLFLILATIALMLVVLFFTFS